MACVGADCAKEISINYAGGSITSTRGTLEAIFKQDALPSACEPVKKNPSRKAHTRVRVIGSPPTQVKATEYELRIYPKTNSSFASGGIPIMLSADGGWWTARLTGNVEDFVAWICTNLEDLQTVFFFQSPSGAKYGPYSPQ